LNAGDQIIVEGLQKAKPGATVKANPWQPAGAAGAAAPNGSGSPAAAAPDKK
jgi:membrane fusion protein (multidrug efflux system)